MKIAVKRYFCKRSTFFTFHLMYLMFFVFTSCQNDLSKTSQKVLPSTITIYTYDVDGQNLSLGSGFFFNNDGSVVTNKHILDNAHDAIIKLITGEQYNVTHVMAEDTANDLILLKSDVPVELAVPLKISNKIPKVGEQVFAVGSPEGLENTVSEGIISSIRNFDGYGKVYQLTAPISPGSSGGALFNMSGEVIGVVTFRIKEGQNLNFALPISHLKTLVYNDLPNIKAWRERSDSILVNEHLDNGNEYFLKLEIEKALSSYQEVLKIMPDNAEAHLSIGICYSSLGDFQTAMNHYNTAIELNPNDGSAYSYRAKLKKKLSDWHGAISDYTIAISLPIDKLSKTFAYNDRGFLRLRLRDYTGSIEDFTLFLNSLPFPNADAFFNRGLAKRQLEDYSGAIKDFDEAINIAPENGSYYYFRGLCYIEQQNFERGCIDFASAFIFGYSQANEALLKYCN